MQTYRKKNIRKIEEGGAVTLFQSQLALLGDTQIAHNKAQMGGAFHATESGMNIRGKLTIANNTAAENGGGIYLYQSELTCTNIGSIKIRWNEANENGGGIYAVGSSLRVIVHSIQSSLLDIVNNKAKNGGGLYLEMDAKLYVLRSNNQRLMMARSRKSIIFRGI